MIRRFAPLLVACALTPVSLSAQAETAPTVDELVSFFSQSAVLGKSKGLCMGTAQECADQEKPKGRDMLVTFDLNSAQLTDEAKDRLGVYVQALNDDRLQSIKFAVEGHTDGHGTDAFNDELSRARAATVRAHFIAQGVSEDRLIAVGLGEREPRTADVYDPENRRVEVRVSFN
ncbi:MAG: OmpA family protein [Pseudomonadota bacterium]